MSQKEVLAYDLGGTKVAVGIVNERGKILKKLKEPAQIFDGKEALIEQMGRLGNALLKEFPKIKRVGLASAGPLDTQKGLLLDPTNFRTKNGPIGIVPIQKMLTNKINRPVQLENDAAAAILAEHWIGQAKNKKNAMILTLGTGLGTAVIANNKLVRAGRELHTEAGHIIINFTDKRAVCGCGNIGCAEAFLSGNAFTRMYGPLFQKKGAPEATAVSISDLARSGNKKAIQCFNEYAVHMAVAIRSYIVLYCPEVIVLTGSFAHSSELFLDKTQEHLNQLMVRRRSGIDLMPKIKVSSLQNNAGIIGAAYIALHSN